MRRGASSKWVLSCIYITTAVFQESECMQSEDGLEGAIERGKVWTVD